MNRSYGLALVASIIVTGSLTYIFQAWIGKPKIYCVPDLVELSNSTNETNTIRVNVKVMNDSLSSVKIVGYQSSCLCSRVTGIPATISSNDSVQLVLHVRIGLTNIDSTIELFTDFKNQFRVPLRVKGHHVGDP
jgi:hypothetical protein